ncbi:MAG TPA: DUF3309 domain-containing protein [Pyrinomonadaceae bacterium]|nr:DUF3309 domain-containing protein [Pyrinomonadaceae bacterium]
MRKAHKRDSAQPLPNLGGSNKGSLTPASERQLTEAKRIMGLILLIILIILLLGAVPAWPYSRNWGYGPSGGLGLLVVIVIVLLLMRVF